MDNPDRKLVRYWRPEGRVGGGCYHIGIEIERTASTVIVQDLKHSRTRYHVPIEDVRDVSDELKNRVAQPPSAVSSEVA